MFNINLIGYHSTVLLRRTSTEETGPGEQNQKKATKEEKSRRKRR